MSDASSLFVSFCVMFKEWNTKSILDSFQFSKRMKENKASEESHSYHRSLWETQKHPSVHLQSQEVKVQSSVHLFSFLREKTLLISLSHHLCRETRKEKWWKRHKIVYACIMTEKFDRRRVMRREEDILRQQPFSHHHVMMSSRVECCSVWTVFAVSCLTWDMRCSHRKQDRPILLASSTWSSSSSPTLVHHALFHFSCHDKQKIFSWWEKRILFQKECLCLQRKLFSDWFARIRLDYVLRFEKNVQILRRLFLLTLFCYANDDVFKSMIFRVEYYVFYCCQWHS